MISKRFISKAPVLLALGAALMVGACEQSGGSGTPDLGETVTALDLTGMVVAPVKDETPVTPIDGDQYEGAIVWKPNDAQFAVATVYAADITLTAKAGFTFNGVAADGFKYDGATVTNPAGSGAEIIVTITFPLTAVTSVDGVDEYLDDVSGGDDAADPVLLPVQIDLATEWSSLLEAIEDEGKYVALDLSGCAMSSGNTTFDPGTANTGEKYIVSLVLPNAATGIKAGGWRTSTFKNFTALKSVSGENVQTVGYSAFYDCNGLTTVNLPNATSIGSEAFAYCRGLTSVDISAATSIGNGAFVDCTGLTSVALPAATSIGNTAFSYCTGLTSVDISAATSIGDYAFANCGGLTSVALPAATSIGEGAFYNCKGLTSVALPAATSIGTYAFQEIGNQAITITLGATVPTLGYRMFDVVNSAVTVKVPNGATAWSGKTGTFRGSNTDVNWGNGFKGGGWTGSAFESGGGANAVNSNITLTIKTE
jgi:hypothetical protein